MLTLRRLVARSVDPFTKKEWYDIKAPSNFTVRSCGKTPVTRTTGTSAFCPPYALGNGRLGLHVGGRLHAPAWAG